MKNRLIYLPLLILGVMVVAANAQYDRAESSGDYGLPVLLSSFSASSADRVVILNWRTVSEIDLVGFDLYRAPQSEANFQRINAELIPAQGTGTTPQEYQYRDTGLQNGWRYYYRLAIVNLDGSENFAGATLSALVGSEADVALPGCLRYEGNFPEPFNGETRLAFSVFERTHVVLQIYNLRGQRVATLLDRDLEPGQYQEIFSGDALPSGIYFSRLQAADGLEIISKMVLLR